MFWTNFLIYVLLTLFVIDCALMCLVILMQRSKQEGLGAAFGGGFTESVWGAQTSQVLVKTTVVLAALFFLISIALARLYTHRVSLMERGSVVQQELLKPVAPVVTNAVPVAPAPAINTVPAPVPPSPTTNAAAPVEPAKPAAK